MLIMDRYLLRQFVWVFCIFFGSFVGLYVVADLVNKYDALSSSYGARHDGVAFEIAAYYGPRIASFFDQISPLMILISAMFTVAAFRQHNEMTALMAAGISKARIVRPILAAAAVVALLSTANRELLLPALRQQLSYEAKDLTENYVRGELRPQYDNETDILLGGSGVVLLSREIERPLFSLPATLDRYGGQLTARRARYLEADGRHRAGYLLLDVKQPSELVRGPSLKLGERPVIITPRDADWLKPGDCFVVSQVDFEQLSSGHNWQRFASTCALIAGLRNPSLDYGADVRVAIHARLLQPILDLTLLFLGLPLVLTRENRNLFVASGLCVLVVLVFMLVILGCHYLGESLALSPALAAWLPMLIFVPLAVALSEPFRE